MNEENIRERLRALRRFAMPVAIAGLTLALLAAALWPARFFPSYLFGFLFWMGITLGSLPILMLHHLVGGHWGFPLRRVLEAAASTLPLMAIFAVVLFFGLQYLYEWARPGAMEQSALLRHKQIFLNLPAYTLRLVLAFGVWGVLAFFLLRWSREQDGVRDPAPTIRLRILSGPGLVLFCLVTTFVYIDWIMALEPDWYSSIFPVVVIIGQVLCALSLAIFLFTSIGPIEVWKPHEVPTQFNHLGNLLLAFVLFWTYVSFGQILIIYAGNLPHEIGWYLHRMDGGWLWIGILLALVQFAAPFLVLLFRTVKRRQSSLRWVAFGLLGAQLLANFWYVVPSFRRAFSVDWFDPITVIAIGSAWLVIFSNRILSRPLLPKNDPRQI
jgi:hypothetical protein